MDRGDYLFVYGTLRSGLAKVNVDLRQRSEREDAAHHLIRGHAIFVATGTLQGKLYDLGRYPGAVPSSGAKDLVLGELYRLTDAQTALKILDLYEGPRFKRQRVTIKKQRGERVSAWTYLYAGTVGQHLRIHSGDYLRYRNSVPG